MEAAARCKSHSVIQKNAMILACKTYQASEDELQKALMATIEYKNASATSVLINQGARFSKGHQAFRMFAQVCSWKPDDTQRQMIGTLLNDPLVLESISQTEIIGWVAPSMH